MNGTIAGQQANRNLDHDRSRNSPPAVQKQYKKFGIGRKWLDILGIVLAPQVGLEPTTLRLTAECSAIELLRSVGR